MLGHFNYYGVKNMNLHFNYFNNLIEYIRLLLNNNYDVIFFHINICNVLKIKKIKRMMKDVSIIKYDKKNTNCTHLRNTLLFNREKNIKSIVFYIFETENEFPPSFYLYHSLFSNTNIKYKLLFYNKANHERGTKKTILLKSIKELKIYDIADKKSFVYINIFEYYNISQYLKNDNRKSLIRKYIQLDHYKSQEYIKSQYVTENITKANLKAIKNKNPEHIDTIINSLIDRNGDVCKICFDNELCFKNIYFNCCCNYICFNCFKQNCNFAKKCTFCRTILSSEENFTFNLHFQKHTIYYEDKEDLLQFDKSDDLELIKYNIKNNKCFSEDDKCLNIFLTELFNYYDKPSTFIIIDKCIYQAVLKN